jgi:hypothetical protein
MNKLCRANFNLTNTFFPVLHFNTISSKVFFFFFFFFLPITNHKKSVINFIDKGAIKNENRD